MASTAAEYQAIIDAIDAAILASYTNGGIVEYEIDGRHVKKDLSAARSDRAMYAKLISGTSGSARNYAKFDGV